MKSTLSRQIRRNFGFDVKQHFASKDELCLRAKEKGCYTRKKTLWQIV